MRNNFITTFSKIHFTPLAPRQEDILIADIAHALSLMTRANGHFPEFYSVAQHCMDCAAEAQAEQLDKRAQLACLLHDASEAYLSDITRPVKANLSEYRRIEKTLQDAIYQKYLPDGLTEEEEATVKRIDDACLYHEFVHFTGEQLFAEEPRLIKMPTYNICPFREVEEAFLGVFYRLID